MNLKEYLSSKERGEHSRLADYLGISRSHISQMIAGNTAISNTRCVQIEQATNGQVTRQDLRPDDWHLIWPELADKKPETVESTATRMISADHDNKLVIDPVNRKGDRRLDERRSRERRQNSNGGGRRVGERRMDDRRVAERRAKSREI